MGGKVGVSRERNENREVMAIGASKSGISGMCGRGRVYGVCGSVGGRRRAGQIRESALKTQPDLPTSDRLPKICLRDGSNRHDEGEGESGVRGMRPGR
jgi:hypothetical protein